MTDTGTDAAQRHIDGLAEPRRSQMQHLHDLILATEPDMDVRVLDYSGQMIGYGWYAYRNSRGPAGDWFSVGLANRKAFISLYAMASTDGGYLVEAMRDRFPGTKSGRSCINITKPDQVDDDAVRELVRASWAQYKDGFDRAG